MKKIKKYICLMVSISLIFTLLNFTAVYAEEITATASVDDRDVTITGQLPNKSGSHMVTLLVGEEDNIIYIDQKDVASTGAFSFAFTMPEGLPSGSYNYKIGCNSGAEVFNGTIEFAPIQRRKFIDADIDIELSAYVPSVTGTIRCADGKNVVVNIVNTTDNIVIKNETITSSNGIYRLSSALPSLLYSKTYQISIVCNGNKGTLMSINADIVSEIYKVTVSGTATTADGVTMDINAKSTNTDLIDKYATISGTTTQSITIPNLIPSAAFNVSVDGYEEYTLADEYSLGSVNGIAGEEAIIVVKGQNIANFENRIFELIYDDSQLEAVDLFGLHPDNSVEITQKGNVEIVSFTAGCIEFKIHNINIPEGKVWSGVLNLFKFKFKEGHTGGSFLLIR